MSRMLRSTILVTLLSFLGAIVSLLNQLVIARFFGAGPAMDAYLVGISLPLSVGSLLAGILGYQLVPALQRAATASGSSEGLLRALLLGFGGSMIVLGMLGSVAANSISGGLLGGATWSSRSLVVDVSRIAWFWMPLSVIGAIYTAALHIRQRFFLATLSQSLPMLGALCGCIFAHARLGIRAVAWGQLAGYVTMVIGLRSALRVETDRRPDWNALIRLIKEMPAALGALLIFFIYPFSDAIWGTRAGPSGVSHLGYIQRLLVGFAGLTIVGATTVLFPQFARQAAAGDAVALRTVLSKGLRAILLLVVPASVLLSVLALPVLQILFERGAFRLEDAISISKVMPPMLAGMVAMSCANLVFRALFAQGALRVAVVMGVAGSIIYFCLSGLLVGSIGLPGVGIAYAVAWWLPLVFGIRHLWNGKGPTEPPALDKTFLIRFLSASFLVAIVCRIGATFLPPPESADRMDRFVVFSATSLIAIVVYLITGNTVLATDELRQLTKHLRAIVTTK